MKNNFQADMLREYEKRVRALEDQLNKLVVTPGRYLLERMFIKTGIVDNTATSIFRISTTDESGSNDAGGYACEVFALIGHAVTGSTATDTATKSFHAHFARAMEDTGTGVNSAVTEISETASAATTGATRDISTVTMTVTETSEFNQDIKFQIDLTGASVTTAQVVCVVRLIYYGFTTPPTMSQL